MLDETVKVELADPPLGTLKLDGFSKAVKPDEGKTEADNETVPAKPFTLLTVIFEVAE